MDTNIGTVLSLDATGERLIMAIANGDWSRLTEREYDTFRHNLHPAGWITEEHPTLSYYHEALALVRAGETSAAAIARALGGDAPDGEEGNVWSLFDRRHRTRLPASEMHETAEQGTAWETVEDAKGDGEEDFPTRLRPIGLDVVTHDEDELAAEADDILIDDATGRIYVTWIGFSYVAGVWKLETRKWLEKAGLGPRLNILDGLEAFLERQRLVPVKVSRIPRELLITALGNIAIYRDKLQRRQATGRPNHAAEAKAIKAAALLDGVAARIGWAEIERLTGLRHVRRIASGRV